MHENGAASQVGNTSQPNSIILRINQFKSQLSDFRSVVIEKKAGFNMKLWCNNTSFFTHFDGFEYQSLIDELTKLEKNADSFSRYYDGSLNWKKSLTGISTMFDSTNEIFLAAQEEVRRGGNLSDPQRKIITTALEELIVALRGNSTLLYNSTAAFAVFVQNNSSYLESIQKELFQVDSEFQEYFVSAESVLKETCPNESLQIAKTIRDHASKPISDSFVFLKARSRELDEHLANVLGTLVNSQTTLKSIIALLNTVDDIASANLHFSSALIQWKHLVDTVTTNLI